MTETASDSTVKKSTVKKSTEKDTVLRQTPPALPDIITDGELLLLLVENGDKNSSVFSLEVKSITPPPRGIKTPFPLYTGLPESMPVIIPGGEHAYLPLLIDVEFSAIPTARFCTKEANGKADVLVVEPMTVNLLVHHGNSSKIRTVNVRRVGHQVSVSVED